VSQSHDPIPFEAMPPFRTLPSAVDLVVEQVNLADRPWQAVLASYQGRDNP